MNARSLLPKLDMIQIRACSICADIIVVSETWLSKSILDKDVAIDGYNIYHSDRPRKGSGGCLCNCLDAQVLFSGFAPKHFEILALGFHLFGNQPLTFVCCYWPLLTSPNILPSSVQLLSELHFN